MYESTFHDESTGINLTLLIYLIFIILMVKVKILIIRNPKMTIAVISVSN